MIAPACPSVIPLLVTSEVAAEMLAVSPRTLARLTEPHGALRAVRIGSAKHPILRYRVSDLEAWIDGQCTELRQGGDTDHAQI